MRRVADAPNVTSGTIVAVELDVTSEESVTEAVKSVRERVGSIDVLVNNAAVWLTGAIEETPIGEMERVLDVNLLGPVRLLKSVVPVMRPSLDVVVDAIVRAAFDATTPLRVPVGPDAEMLIAMRSSMSDDEFVVAMSALFEG